MIDQSTSEVLLNMARIIPKHTTPKHPKSQQHPGCYGVGNEEQQQDAIQCDFAWAAGNPTCAGMYSLWGGGAWPDSGNNFADYSAAYAINVDATFPAPLQSCEKPTNVKGNWYKPSSTPTCQFANWCSGAYAGDRGKMGGSAASALHLCV